MSSSWFQIGNYRYRADEKIGSGQFGSVFKGRSVNDGGYVAVKLVCADPEFQSQAEIDALQKLSKNKTSYIVRLIDSLPHLSSSIALIFELADGCVQDLLRKPEFIKGFPAPLIIQVYSQISTALHFVALSDLVHRDLKPANVLFWNQPGNKYLFKLGDFGGARPASIDMRSLVGTPGYACEAVINNILERGVYSYSPVECELFALSSMLYQLCCGRLPFECQVPRCVNHEHQDLREKAKALSFLFANRGLRNISGIIDRNGKHTYREHLPLSHRCSNSLQRILENVIRKLMNSEKPAQKALVKSVFENNMQSARELENLRPHRILHLHKSEIVNFYATSKAKYLQRSDVNESLSPSDAIGCECERVKLMFPSGAFVKLEELNHTEAPSDPTAISCIAFCFDADSELPLEWQKTSIVDDPNDSLAAKAVSTLRIARMFTELLGIPQEVSNFYGRSVEDFRVRFQAFYDHCSSVSAVFTRFRTYLTPALVESLTPLIEKIGYLERNQRSQSATEPFELILDTVRKMDYGQFDEDRIVDIYKGSLRQPRDEKLDVLDTVMINNVRQQLLKKMGTFAKLCYDILGYALTNEKSPFEAHRNLDKFSEEIRTLSANAYDELAKRMNLRDARTENVGTQGLQAVKSEVGRLLELAKLNLNTSLAHTA